MSDKESFNDIPNPEKKGRLDPDKLSLGQQESASLADVRHELRTPLNHIIGYSEMLLEEAETKNLGDFSSDIRKIHGAGKHLLTLLNEFLDPASPQATALSLTSKTKGPPHPFLEAEPRSHLLAADLGAAKGALTGNLLVVDDDESNRDMLSRRLIQQGHNVCTAETGAHALELIKTQPVDLVLLDIVMPEMSGHEVLNRMKADSTWRDIPVIMISALHEIESVVQCIEQGAEDYLPKPFNPVLLRARIGACLEKKRLRDQEVKYLKDVAHVSAAAAGVEDGTFELENLTEVGRRGDELGRLARVFQRMALEVQAREQRLKQQIQELRIEIDEVKKVREVAEITETDYFQELHEKARMLRSQKRKT